ncbi:MAG: CDP-glycerol glycerophosphotransferase family protein [Anaerolineales bacterium]|nr:CDP-glycerol glycerophosphotransferase family protein [Anaerolineales bacterium]
MLAEFSQPVIALAWDDPQLGTEIESLGGEVFITSHFKHGHEFEHVRARINHWHRRYRNTVTTAIDARRNALFMDGRSLAVHTLRNALMTAEQLLPGNMERLFAKDEELFWQDTNVADFVPVLENARPDAVFSITPFIYQDEPWLRLGRKADIPLFTAILSFDNITARTWLPVTFRHYMVWNKYNKQELLRSYPTVKVDDVSVTGPPQFDFYWDKSYIWDENTWRRELGLPMDAPVIFWGSGYVKIVPNETSLLLDLDFAIENGQIPDKPVILFRRHPVDIESRWTPILKQCKYVVVDRPWQAREANGKMDISRYDIERLASTLYHSCVHVNVSSTLTVDGAIFNKPQVGPAYDPEGRPKYDRVLKELYLREHYLPITNSGGLDLARNTKEFIDAVSSALEKPGKLAVGRQKIVEEICAFSDGESTERISRVLKGVLTNGQ